MFSTFVRAMLPRMCFCTVSAAFCSFAACSFAFFVEAGVAALQGALPDALPDAGVWPHSIESNVSSADFDPPQPMLSRLDGKRAIDGERWTVCRPGGSR